MLFEPHTELIRKGKTRPAEEFGRRLLVSTQQDGLILDYRTMDSGSETAEVVPLTDRLLNSYGEGNLKSISFDKGFSIQEDRELLELYIPEVIMPKKGHSLATLVGSIAVCVTTFSSMDVGLVAQLHPFVYSGSKRNMGSL